MKYRIHIPFIIAFLFFQSPLIAEQPFSWQVGEELTYRVDWAVIRLGTIRVQVLEPLKTDSVEIQHVRFHIDSNPFLFFIDMHSVYDCYIDPHMRPVKYVAAEKDNGQERTVMYSFFYEDSIFTIDQFSGTNPMAYDHKILPLYETVYDGISLIFFVRKTFAQNHKKNVVAFIDDRMGEVVLNFHSERKSVRIDALDEDLPAYYINGEIKMTGIAGVTGPYEGWFARDGQRPPLRAKLKVFIGNVEVQLEKWNRWSPK